MTTLSPEQIAYIVEWWRSGNESRPGHLILLPGTLTKQTSRFGVSLNPAGCTIAKMAIALEQACETAEESQAWVGSPGLDDEIETMRANKKELLG